MSERSRISEQSQEREERRRKREEYAAQQLAQDLEKLNDLFSQPKREGTSKQSTLNRGHFVISTPSSISESDPFFYNCIVSSPEDRDLANPFGVSPIKEEGESSVAISSSPKIARRKRKVKRPSQCRIKLQPRALSFWDNPYFEFAQLFDMAVPTARAVIRLADFTQYVGLWDEDPDAHVQKFEITCVANEIIHNDQRGQLVWKFRSR